MAAGSRAWRLGVGIPDGISGKEIVRKVRVGGERRLTPVAWGVAVSLMQ